MLEGMSVITMDDYDEAGNAVTPPAGGGGTEPDGSGTGEGEDGGGGFG